MKKLLTSLLLCASLFFIAACDVDDTVQETSGTTTTGQTTAAPVTDNQKSPIKLSNYRLVSEFIDNKLYVSVDVEINYEDMVPVYDLSLTNSAGETILEELSNDENPDLSSCNLALSNANLQTSGSLKCNSMFEVGADGTYTLVVNELDSILREVTLEVKDNQVTIVE